MSVIYFKTITVIKTRELELGDVVRRADGGATPWSTCIVVKMDDDVVTIHRPYGVTADFRYTGGVIAYTGIEVYTVDLDGATDWVIFERKELK